MQVATIVVMRVHSATNIVGSGRNSSCDLYVRSSHEIWKIFTL